MSVLALIPARKGSKGIPGKNVRSLYSPKEGNRTLIAWAVYCAQCADIDQICVSTDYEVEELDFWLDYRYQRPPALAQDETPMIDVVRHALEQIPGPPEQIIVLLQPTQPFRTPAHVKAAIALLESTGADSVVSVVELPRTHHPDSALIINNLNTVPLPPSTHMRLAPFTMGDASDYVWLLSHQPTRRQDNPPVYIRDGTVYAFKRTTVERHGDIYGLDVRPLVIPHGESCSLDTEADWADVERRWHARQAARS